MGEAAVGLQFPLIFGGDGACTCWQADRQAVRQQPCLRGCSMALEGFFVYAATGTLPLPAPCDPASPPPMAAAFMEDVIGSMAGQVPLRWARTSRWPARRAWGLRQGPSHQCSRLWAVPALRWNVPPTPAAAVCAPHRFVDPRPSPIFQPRLPPCYPSAPQLFCLATLPPCCPSTLLPSYPAALPPSRAGVLLTSSWSSTAPTAGATSRCVCFPCVPPAAPLPAQARGSRRERACAAVAIAWQPPGREAGTGLPYRYSSARSARCPPCPPRAPCWAC